VALQSPRFALSQDSDVIVPSGTPLPVQIDEHLSMKVGEPVRAHLLYAVYSGDTLLIPEKTILMGTVVGLRSNRSRRIHARLNGDFTPFHIPVVRFTQIILSDGTSLPLVTAAVTDGAPVYRLVAVPPHKGGIIRQQVDIGIQIVRDDLSIFTAPDKTDRLVQFLYHQLPYHPERIEKGTAWTLETSEPFVLPAHAFNQPVDVASAGAAKSKSPAKEVELASEGPPTWILQSYLADELDSATAHVGQPIKAVVAEPIFNADKTVAVPQGATLIGAVTQVRRARSFGRAGVLRFDFRQIILPGDPPQNVQASMVGADSAGKDLSLNSEGQVKSRPKDKISIPLILVFLASRPLDEGEHGASSNQFGKNFVGSNGFGLVGRIIGIAGGPPAVAAGIGYYGAALAFYDRWIARGPQVTFARDTRIVLQTTPRRSAVLPSKATSPDPQ
jgi:hypothetical protein